VTEYLQSGERAKNDGRRGSGRRGREEGTEWSCLKLGCEEGCPMGRRS